MGKRIIPLVLAGCIFFGGCALLAYPKVSQWLNNRHQSEVIADYSSAVDDLDNDFIVGKFQKTLFYGFYRTLYICLYNDVQFFEVTCLDL